MSVDWYKRKLGGPQPNPGPDTWNLPRHTQPTPSYEPHQQSYIPSSDAPPLDENGQMHFMDAAVRWRGGEGAKEVHRCPKCGSGNFFSRKAESKITQSGTCAPAPHCFDCNYNGLFQIFGGD